MDGLKLSSASYITGKLFNNFVRFKQLRHICYTALQILTAQSNASHGAAEASLNYRQI
jgi:hypothetical protein